MADFRPFSPCWGDISFTEAPRTTARCYAGAIFLSRSPFGATARARGVAWLRCQWAAAGPGRASGQRASHASVHQAPPVWRARLRCPRVAGPGRTTRRRAERSSRRGRLAGGPPPTGTPSCPAQQHTTRRPEHQRRNTPLRHNKTAQPHRGRAAQTISERGSAQDHDDVRITETAFLTDARNAKL